MKKLALSFAALTFLSGCAYVTPVSNTTDLSKVDFSNSYEFKQGSDCSYSLLGLLPVTPGARFMEADKHALDNPKMCGIAFETKEAADVFFARRERLTGQPQDKSYQDLPSRGSLTFTPNYAYFDMPYDIKKAAALKTLLSNKRGR